VGLTLTQRGLTWQNQPVPPNWFSSAESQVGWGGPNGLDPKVDPTFLSECVSSAGTESFFKKRLPNGFLTNQPIHGNELCISGFTCAPMIYILPLVNGDDSLLY
jgi:hypothetical protein